MSKQTLFIFNKRYFLLTIAIFLTEVLIAMFVHDRFIRPYFGDFLVVILIYCFFKSFLNIAVMPMAIAVLIFSYLVETAQYFNLVYHLGLQDYKLARIVIGVSFEWIDMLAYTLGILAVIGAEKIVSSGGRQTKSESHT